MKMIELVEQLPAQLREALNIGAAANINKHSAPIRNVFVSGIGGSGIGGSFVQELTRSEIKVPFSVGKGYDIPNFINKHTLAIVSSYSGNTEETLSAFELLVPTGAKIVCIASGGKVIAKAKELGFDYIQVPAGSPSPRACLGYSIVQQLYILTKLKLISGKLTKQINGAIALMEKNQDAIRKAGEKLANQLHGKLPIIYTTDRMESIAVRFRQQVNENAKALCWHHVIPEMNHNELVGWREKNDKLAVVYFRHKEDLMRNQVRIGINQTIIKNYTPNIIEVWSKGKNLVEQTFYLVFLGDYASCFLADSRGMDSIEIGVIDYLKSELGKV
jgi:glucose/mannose-6-phosphate isomerase